VVSGASSNQVAVLLGNGDGTFQAPILTDTNTSPAMIAIGDINGDGFPDLVLTDCCGLSEASYLLGNGDGTFQPEVQFPSGPNPSGIAVADLTGDGRLDLAVIGQVQQNDQGTFSILGSGFPLFSIAPAAPTLTPSQTQQFTVTGYFGTSTAVTWSLDTPVGTISTAGLYTAPPSITTQQNVNVIATSVSNTNYSASMPITLSPPPTQYKLTITASPAAGGIVTPANGGTYAAGTVVPITATAASGYQFTGWTGTVANPSSASTTVTMSAAEAVTANFSSLSTPAAFFTGQVSLGSGVEYLQFPDNTVFGYYSFVASSIFYHYDMGYEAFIPGSASDLYLYDFASGHWWYTSNTLIPYLYDFTLKTWIYYFPNTTSPGHYSANPRYFSNLTTGIIFTL